MQKKTTKARCTEMNNDDVIGTDEFDDVIGIDEFYALERAQRSTNRQEGGFHYQLPIQPVEYIYKNGLGYMEGNVIKYVTRHADKAGLKTCVKPSTTWRCCLSGGTGRERLSATCRARAVGTS